PLGPRQEGRRARAREPQRVAVRVRRSADERVAAHRGREAQDAAVALVLHGHFERELAVVEGNRRHVPHAADAADEAAHELGLAAQAHLEPGRVVADRVVDGQIPAPERGVGEAARRLPLRVRVRAAQAHSREDRDGRDRAGPTPASRPVRTSAHDAILSALPISCAPHYHRRESIVDGLRGRGHSGERALADEEYDAIVVGSGISGGWAAKELTEKGLRVLMLERGKNIEHIVDYVNATKGPWEYPFREG